VRLSALAVPLLVLALVACGGSESDGEPTSEQVRSVTQPQTRQQFIRQADVICRRFEALPPSKNDFDRIDHLRNTDLDAYVSEAGELYGREARNIEHKVEALERLEPPADDAPQFEKVVDGLREQGSLARSLSGAGLRGDVDAVAALFEEAERQAQRLNGLTDGFGLHDC
jgi:hypothetical protein